MELRRQNQASAGMDRRLIFRDRMYPAYARR